MKATTYMMHSSHFLIFLLRSFLRKVLYSQWLALPKP